MCEGNNMKKQNILINIVLILTLLLLWSGILLFTFILWISGGVLYYFKNGLLLLGLGLIYLSAFVLPIACRKRIKKYIGLPLSMIISTFLAVLLAGGVLLGAKCYISAFTPEKWSENPNLRYCMTKDLEEEYNIMGMEKDELTSLLGAPDFGAESKMIYIIGINLIDPIYYEIALENGIVIGAKTTIGS